MFLTRIKREHEKNKRFIIDPTENIWQFSHASHVLASRPAMHPPESLSCQRDILRVRCNCYVMRGPLSLISCSQNFMPSALSSETKTR